MKAASRNFNLRNVLVRIENLAYAFEFKKEYAEALPERKHLVRTACGSGRLNFSYQSANESEINRPLPLTVLTEKGFSFPKPFTEHIPAAKASP